MKHEWQTPPESLRHLPEVRFYALTPSFAPRERGREVGTVHFTAVDGTVPFSSSWRRWVGPFLRGSARSLQIVSSLELR